MSTITPPPPPSTPAAQSAPLPSAVVSQPPAALTGLDIGAKLEASIKGLDAQGRVLVDTRIGQITLQTNISLPPNGPIQLQVQSLGTQVFLLITAIHGKNPAAALRSLSDLLPPTLPGFQGQHSAGSAGTSAINQAGVLSNPATGLGGANPPVSLTQGATLSATLLQPSSAIYGNGQAGTATGGFNLTATGKQSPVLSATPSGPGLTPTTSAAVGSVAARAATSQPLPAGSAFAVQVLTVQPSAGATPPAITGQPISLGMTLSGVTTGTSGVHQSIVQTPTGSIAIATTTPLPAGSVIELEVIQLPRADLTPQDRALTLRFGQVIAESKQWLALEETARTLLNAQPATAQQLLGSVMPRADANLTANLLFFLFALRGGDVKQWLGDAPSRALEKLKPGLLGRLRDDFSGLSRLADEPPNLDGRMLPIPFLNGLDIEQLRLLIRRREEDEDDEDDPRKGPGIRFVVDLNLSRLGRLQLDGFVQDGTKRFDLIVRSDTRLPDTVQNGIRDIFEGAIETTGVTGGLAFQAAPANFVGIDAPAPDDGLGLMV